MFSTATKSIFISIIVASLNACSVADDPVTPTGTQLDGPILEISSRNPPSDQGGVSISTEITMTFDTELVDESVSTGTFLLISGSALDPLKADLPKQPILGTVTTESTVSGSTVTFTPGGDLALGTNYIALATSVITDVEGKSIPDYRLWEFETTAKTTNVPPVVSSTSPINGAINVTTNRLITASFSEPLNPATVNSETFLLQTIAGDIVSGNVSYTGTTATFSPNSPLAIGTTYQATITTGIADFDTPPNNLLMTYTWTFTTLNVADNTPPNVSNVNPAVDAINVPINTFVTAEFDEALDPTTVTASTFTLSNTTFQPGQSVTGLVSYSGTTAVFTPNADLSIGTYTATITSGVTDFAGNALAAPYSWSFDTGVEDNTPPSVSVVNPGIGVIDVPINTAVTAGFTEPLDPTTVNAASFLLEDLGALTPGPVAGTVTYNGTTATFTPNTPTGLTPSSQHRATIVATVTDLAGNSMVANYGWTFTTAINADNLAPTVTDGSEEPAAGDGGVPDNITTVSVSFSEPLDPATVTTATFTLTLAGSGAVPGTVQLIGATAIYTPTGGLPTGTYTATIIGGPLGVTDLAGNPLASNFSWIFATVADPDVLAPQIMATCPIAGINNAPVGTDIVVRFSEAMDPTTINTVSFTLVPTFAGVQVPVAATVTYFPATATALPSARLNPAGNLARNTDYTARVFAAVTDLAGIGLNGNTGGALSDYVWSFSTRMGGGGGGTVCPP